MNQEAKDLLTPLTFCVFDLETTGGNHDKDKIIEIGMVRVHNLEIVEKKHYFINPEIRIPEFIQQLTNIKPETVKDAPLIEDVMDEIVEFIGDSILVAHNTSFDVPFINSVLRRLGKSELTNKAICTNLMTKYLIPGIMSSNLSYMSSVFNIKHDQVHSAIEDAKATAKLLMNYLDFFIEKNIKKINQIYYPRNRFELDRTHYTTEDSKEDIINKIKGVNSSMFIVFKGDQGLLLATMPVENPSEEIEFVSSLVNELPWTNITIRLCGSFFESMLTLNQHYTKSQIEPTQKIKEYLAERYLSEIFENVMASYDFIITRHIVKDQFISHPTQNLISKTSLIFKYPGHRKKLLQHMNSYIRRTEKKGPPKKKVFFHRDLVNIVNSYLSRELKANTLAYTFIKSDMLKKEKELHRNLDKFTSFKIDRIDYPKEHI